MKRFAELFIFLLSLTVGSLHGQIAGEVYTYAIYSNKPGDPYPSSLRSADLDIDRRQVEIDVYINDNESISIYQDFFRSEYEMNDSWAKIFAVNQNYICHNFKDSIIHYNIEYDSTLYKVAEKFKIEEWELIDETKKINNIECKKAILRSPSIFNDRVIKTLWYAESINPLLGPMKYVGFPGQVIQVITDFYTIELVYSSKDHIHQQVCDLRGEPITLNKLDQMRSSKFWNQYKNN